MGQDRTVPDPLAQRASDCIGSSTFWIECKFTLFEIVLMYPGSNQRAHAGRIAS